MLFFKAPQNSKRRLAGEIGDLATTAAEHLLSCALEDACAWPGNCVFSPADAPDETWLSAQREPIPDVLLQRGENLGERLNHVDAELRSRGLEKLLYIGTDCPGLDSAYLRQAAAQLDDHDAVFGPSLDGGVVLMGSRLAWPELGGLAWSTEKLGRELTALCRGAGWTTAQLEKRSDIDTVGDLLAARSDLANDPRPARIALTEWLTAHENVLTDGTSRGTA